MNKKNKIQKIINNPDNYGTIKISDIKSVEIPRNRIAEILIEKNINPLLEEADIKSLNLKSEQQWFDILNNKAGMKFNGDDACLFQICQWLDVNLCDIYGRCFGYDFKGNQDCSSCKSKKRWSHVNYVCQK